MSVIQEVIDNLVGGANHFDRIGYPLAAGVNRTLAAKLSDYADITEARAAGFATVEEMTHMMGRPPDQNVPDFLNALYDKVQDLTLISDAFTKVEELTAKMGRTEIQGVSEYLHYLSDKIDHVADVEKAREFDRLTELCSKEPGFSAVTFRPTTGFVAIQIEKSKRLDRLASHFCDFKPPEAEDPYQAYDLVRKQLTELDEVKQAIADTDEENNREPTRIPGDFDSIADFVGGLNTFANNVVSAIEDTVGCDTVASDDGTASSLKKASAYAVAAIEAYAAKPPIPIADLDKHTIKDGEVVRAVGDEAEVFDINDGREIKSFSVLGAGVMYYKEATASKPAICCFRKNSYPANPLDKLVIENGKVTRVPQSDPREAVGYQVATPPPAEVVSLRVHEELDDVAPPPTDAQQCTAYLMNYLDAKFKESSELAFKLDEESTARDQRILDRVPATELSGRDGVFLIVWTLSIAALTAMVFQL